ncbi:MAG: hypothetical protein ACRDGT_09710 [Candidatus Limnocylindria bacterium]
MTRQPAASFLIRLERGDDGSTAGTVTSVQTGERTDFAGLSELATLLERWSEGHAGMPQPSEERRT